MWYSRFLIKQYIRYKLWELFFWPLWTTMYKKFNITKSSAHYFIFSSSKFDTKWGNCGIKYLPKTRNLYHNCIMGSIIITGKLQGGLPVWGYNLLGSDWTLIKLTTHYFNFCTILWCWVDRILYNSCLKFICVTYCYCIIVICDFVKLTERQ